MNTSFVWLSAPRGETRRFRVPQRRPVCEPSISRSTKSPQTVVRSAGRLLAIAEAIDPVLVEEVMWYSIAARSPSKRVIEAKAPGALVERITWYERDVAAALLDGRLKRMLKVPELELIEWYLAFEAWSAIDPRAAVARLERVPMLSVDPNNNRLWINVVNSLSLDPQELWRMDFIEWAPVFDASNRDARLDRF